MEQQGQHKQVGNYSYDITSRPIGKGVFSIVFKGQSVKNPNDVVAIKFIDAQTIQTYSDNQELFKREIYLLMNIKGPHILELRDVVQTSKGNLYIITNFCDEGTLDMIIEKENDKSLSEKRALQILKDISEAFVDMQNSGLKDPSGEPIAVMHRDIKPQNILFEKGVTKLADFGFAKSVEMSTQNTKKMHTFLGTPNYMAPQILNQEEYSYKCDIWSMGVVVYEMIVGMLPWPSASMYKLAEYIKTVPLQFPKKVSLECRNLIGKMLKIEESDRIDWREILKHPAITGLTAVGLNEEPIYNKLSTPNSDTSGKYSANSTKDSKASNFSNDLRGGSDPPKQQIPKSSGIKIISSNKVEETKDAPPVDVDPKLTKKRSKVMTIEFGN